MWNALTLLQLALPLLLSETIRTTVASPAEPRFIPREVCYDGIGCFNTGGNFFNIRYRPFSVLPQSPEEIAPTFTVYTRSQRSGRRIVYNKADTIAASGFNAGKWTRVIVHGYTDSGDSDWMVEMRQKLLAKEDSNVVHFSWKNGASGKYQVATANTRVAGALLAQMISWLEQVTGASRSRFHLIGHSLGSHLSGYAGERLRGLARITGMDPAGPLFENTHPEVRLDPTDAEFVDVIHTDGDYIINVVLLNGGFGLMQSLGHVDFYPNGGRRQPDCTATIKEIVIEGNVRIRLTCSHSRVLSLMTNSIAGSNYKALHCPSYSDFKEGKCQTCGSTGCALMGFNANQWRPNGKKNVVMFLDTESVEPFETRQFVIRVAVSGSSDHQYGDVSVVLESSGGVQTPELTVADKQTMTPGQEVTTLATSAQPALSSVSKIRLSWTHRKTDYWGKEYLGISKVYINEGFAGSWSTFCASADVSLLSGQSVTLSRSSRC